ncbi:hypothetical protein M9H77_01883 [Catharanthus roseus]|uniref:Uncharacterized protein n=1 Tax=Catharanthus roseus TaxID=4058 RepID=A0ACC0C6U0_CATRO|nr:hypothetical protein M9H77_01883 [Catharanthus roseus]
MAIQYLASSLRNKTDYQIVRISSEQFSETEGASIPIACKGTRRVDTSRGQSVKGSASTPNNKNIETPPCCKRLSLVVFLTIVFGEYLRETREGEEERDTRDSCLPRLLGLRVPNQNLHTSVSTLSGAAILAVVRPPVELTRGGG